MFSQPKVNTYLHGDKRVAKQHLPVAFKLLEDYKRRYRAAEPPLEQDKFVRNINGITYEIKMHHGMTSMHVHAPVGEPEEGAPAGKKKIVRRKEKIQKELEKDVYYRMVVHADVITNTSRKSGTPVITYVEKADVSSAIAFATLKDGAMVEGPTTVVSSKLVLPGAGYTTAEAVWENGDTQDDIAYKYDEILPSEVYGPAQLYQPHADMQLFITMYEPQGGAYPYPWNNFTSPRTLHVDYQFPQFQNPGNTQTNAGTCNDPIYHELVGGTPLPTYTANYAVWRRADTARCTRYFPDQAYGCSTYFNYEYNPYEGPAEIRGYWHHGYYSRVFGQIQNGRVEHHAPMTAAEGVLDVQLGGFGHGTTDELSGQRVPCIQHHDWGTVDAPTDYGFHPGFVDSTGFCFYGETYQANQIYFDEFNYESWVNCSVLNSRVVQGYGLDPFSGIRDSQLQTDTTAMWNQLIEAAIVAGGGTILDATAVDDILKGQTLAVFGHVAEDILAHEGTVISSPLYNIKMMLLPFVASSQVEKVTKTYSTEEFEVDE